MWYYILAGFVYRHFRFILYPIALPSLSISEQVEPRIAIVSAGYILFFEPVQYYTVIPCEFVYGQARCPYMRRSKQSNKVSEVRWWRSREDSATQRLPRNSVQLRIFIDIYSYEFFVEHLSRQSMS